MLQITLILYMLQITLVLYTLQKILVLYTVADLGFSPAGVPTPKVGVLTNFFGRKLHENERIWTPRGGGARPWRPHPLDPPLLHGVDNSSIVHLADNATFLEIFLNVTACDTEQYQCYVLSTGTDEGQAQASLEVSNRNYSLPFIFK